MRADDGGDARYAAGAGRALPAHRFDGRRVMRSLNWHRVAMWTALAGRHHFRALGQQRCRLNKPRITAIPLVAQSRALANELGARLRAALTEAVDRRRPCRGQSPCAGIFAPQDRCRARTPVRARRVGRTSVRTRNAIERAGTVAGRCPCGTSSRRAPAGRPSSSSSRGEPGVARYMRAIFAEGVCLLCHGETLAPEVGRGPRPRIIRTTPPPATGAGDLRGAFVVVWSQPR